MPVNDRIEESRVIVLIDTSHCNDSDVCHIQLRWLWSKRRSFQLFKSVPVVQFSLSSSFPFNNQ